MDDKRIEELLIQMKDERFELPPKLVKRTAAHIERRHMISLLIVAVLWSALFQFFIGMILIVLVPGLRQDWVWGTLILIEITAVIVQIAIIFGIRERKDLSLITNIRTVLGGIVNE